MIWAIYIFFDALINWWWIEHMSKVPSYHSLNVTRGFAFISISIYYNVTPDTFWCWLCFCACSFWIMFDATLNIMRNRNLFYIGTNSKIDKLGLKYHEAYWSAKVIALILVIISIQQLWMN